MGKWNLLGGVICILASSPGQSSSTPARPANPACGLLTAAEIEGTLGGKVTGLTSGPSGLPNGVEVCTATTPAATINIRLIPQLAQATVDANKNLLDMAVQMGARVDKEASGPISCHSITPPPALAASIGFGTTCSVSKPPKQAVIEIGTKTQAAMLPPAKLRVLAEKMLSRF